MTDMTERVQETVARLRKWGEGASLAKHFLGTQSAREDCAEAANLLEAIAARLAEVEAEPVGPSDQREKYDSIRAHILAGKASQQDAADAIKRLCDDNERLAVIAGRNRRRAEEAEAEVARLRTAAGAAGVLLDEIVACDRQDEFAYNLACLDQDALRAIATGEPQ